MSSLATHLPPNHSHSFSSSAQSSPSSPSFPHQQPLSINGTAFHLNLRPGTSSGTISSPTLKSDASGLDYATLPSWSDQHVAAWISHSLPTLSSTYADVFAQNDIRGNVLLEVDQTALKEMGVRSVGDRVKICVAVRALRSKYLAAVGGGPGGNNRTSVLLSRFTQSRPSSPLVHTLSPPSSVLSTPPGSANSLNLPPSTIQSNLNPSLVDSRPGSGSYSARNISIGNRIPPPLHLAQSNVTTPLVSVQLQQAQYNSVSPPSRTTSPRTGQLSATPPSTNSSASSSAITTSSRSVPPPSLPPPNSKIPLPPPSSSTNGSTRDWLGEIPGYNSAPSSSINSNPNTNSQLRPSTATQAGNSTAATRHKASSSSLGARPSTAQASLSSYSGHPYAANAQSHSQLLPSPLEHPSSSHATTKSDSHQGYTVGRSTFARPSTAGGLVSSSGVIASSVSSTPLSNLDVMRKAVKFTSADGVTTRVLAVGDAKDGREVLSRVVRKFSTTTNNGSSSTGKEDELDGWGIWTPDQHGMARLLSEAELHSICQNTSAPERARGLFVRKLPSSASAASSPLPLISTTSPSNLVTNQPTSPLQSQSSSSSFSSSPSPNKRGRKLQWVFGDSHAASADSSRPGGALSFTPTTSGYTGTSPTASPTSPNYLGIEIPKMGFEPASPSTSGEGSDSDDEKGYRDQEEYDADGALIISPKKKKSSRSSTSSSGKMNRASTVSVMSGLEAPDWAKDYYGRSSEDGGSTSNGKEGTGGGEGGSQSYVTSPPQRTSSRRSPPTSHDSMITPSAPARRSTTEPHPRSSSPTASVASSLAPSSARKLRNFFGQRPPSELIATHLTEFFPLGLRGSGDKKLSKQVRMSIRKSMGAHGLAGGMGRRMSTNSVASSTRATVGGHPHLAAPSVPGQTSWEKKEESSAMSRFSGSSDGSAGLSHSSQATTRAGGGGSTSATGGRSPRGSLDPPDESAEDQEETSNLIITGEGGTLVPSPESTTMALNSSNSSSRSVSVAGGDDLAETRSIASSLAPSYLDTRSARLSTRRMSRMSGSSRLSVGAQSLWERRSKDSDAASVITVDEVTAELETRRASGVSWGGSYSDEDESVIASDEDDESDEEESETEASEEEEVETGEGAPSKPEQKGMKWIKGALIGAGSFGSVYLGMNPLSGSLMAVKQVELPTGKSHNEERKKSMLEALEREIELLKVLQHENIVQYLDSSTDGQHLNIFLEYVPGGSVAALLSNYGAFEEALVSKFVRQILTGLDYLHEREIIHRDIKGANILVDNKGNIKISDFGISKKVEDNLLSGAKVHRPSLQGSVYWMAPEVVKQTAYTSKADIWSLGCLVVEMLTGAHPWANLTQMQAIFRIGSSGRPTVPDDISNEADDFLEQTFEIEHTARPSARELLAHAFIREDANLQTPTRATFSQGSGSS